MCAGDLNFAPLLPARTRAPAGTLGADRRQPLPVGPRLCRGWRWQGDAAPSMWGPPDAGGEEGAALRTRARLIHGGPHPGSFLPSGLIWSCGLV